MNMRTEPIAIFGAVEVALIAIITALAVAFDWEAEMTAAIAGLVTAGIVVITTYLQRRAVDSPATVEKKVDEALNTPAP